LRRARPSFLYVPDQAALVLAPQGRIVENSPATRSTAHRRARAEKVARQVAVPGPWSMSWTSARDDDRIKALVLDLEDLEGAGLPLMQDLAQSIRWFRESGKKVYAYAESLFRSASTSWPRRRTRYPSTRWATSCSTAWLLPALTFRGTLDKLAVDVNVFKAGSHKSAPTSERAPTCRLRTAKMPRSGSALVWDGYKADVAAARKARAEPDPGLLRRGGRGHQGDGRRPCAVRARARARGRASRRATEFEANRREGRG
jgi:protease-4